MSLKMALQASTGRGLRRGYLASCSVFALISGITASVLPSPASAQQGIVCQVNGNATSPGVPNAFGDNRDLACGKNADASGGLQNGAANTAVGNATNASGDGSMNSAFGSAATANGVNSRNTADGVSSNASGDNSRNLASGAFANASGNQTRNVAVGFATYARSNIANSGNVALGGAAQAGGSGANGSATDFQNAGTTAIGFGSQAGTTALGQTNATAVGNNAQSNAAGATTLGANTRAPGANAVAIGGNAIASDGNTFGAAYAGGANAVAVGNNSITGGDRGTAIGFQSVVRQTDGTAIGSGSIAFGASSIAIGTGGLGAAVGDRSISVGVNSVGLSASSTAIGDTAFAFGTQAVAIGQNAQAGYTGDGSTPINAGVTAIGVGAQAGSVTGGQDNATALGNGALANVAGGTALGQGASVTQASGVALGQLSVASRAGLNGAVELFSGTAVASTNGAVSVGTAGGERQITNVAGGTQATDAVNVRQLQAGIASVPFVSDNGSNRVSPTATSTDASAGGFGATAGFQGTAVGNTSTAGSLSTAVGFGSNAQGFGTAVGISSAATGGFDTAFGSQSAATGGFSTAVGNFSQASATFGTALGNGTGASGASSTALGSGTLATLDNSVGLGANSRTTAASSTAGNDAIGVRNNAGAVTAGGGDVVSIGTTTAARQLQNVAAGAITTTSTDAVNGSQLFSVATNVNAVGNGAATALGGGAAYDPATATFTAPTYTLNNGTVRANNVGDALSNLDVRTTTNTTNITALQNGTAGLVQQANGNAPITVGAATGGAVVNVAGAAGNRQITGVAAGAVTAASTDAVNGSQLFTLGQQAATGVNNLGTTTAAAIGGGATYNPATTSIVGPSYQLNGSATTFTNVVAGQQAIANGAAGPVQYATPGTPSNALNLVGVGGPVTLGNVAAGALNATSTQAVNGSQLFSTNQAVANLQAGTAGPFVSNNANGRLGPAAGGVDASAGGFGATASGTQATALGNTATASAAGASAFGFGATSTAVNATALGQNANAGIVNSVAVGNGSTATVASSTAGNAALGVRNNAGAVAAGSGNVFSVGAAGAARQVENVAAGAVTATSTDAVNGGQLFSVATNVNAVGTGSATAIGGGATYNAAAGTFTGPSYGLNGSTTTFTNVVAGQQAIANGAAGPIQYATPGTPSNSLNLVGTGAPVTLGNVAAGNLSATSTQAVNGSQLFATNQQVATNTTNIATTNQRTAAAFGGGAGVDANGLLTAPTYRVQGGTFSNVGGALGALDGQTTANTANIATNTGNITALQTGQAGPFRDNNTSGSPAPSPTGANAIAGGFGAVASGASSVAIGRNAQATMAGATAIGAGAIATADPTTAVGFNAAATGNEASAFGAFASASGTNSTALGRSATAVGNNATAVGFGSNATEAGSVAVGVGASAQQANSVAVGSGVATTRANQVAIGTAAQTYTLAGVTSAQSLSAQTGGTGFVTTDAAGNLASSNFGPSSIAALDGRVGNLEAGLGNLSRFAIESRKEARRGIATALALSSAPLPSAPGRLTYVLNGATFRGEYAVGGAIAYRLDTALPVALTVGVAGGAGQVGGRIGIMGEL